MNPCFFVYDNEDGSLIGEHFFTYEAALQYAEQRALRQPSRTFYVLSVVAGVTASNPLEFTTEFPQ